MTRSKPTSDSVDSSELAGAAPLTRRRARKPRSELLAETRAGLIAAAAELIGEIGYADCSITRITSRAGVAQGTFYTYFESRQELFDQLLPELGKQLMAFVAQRMKGARSLTEVEERGFRGFIDFHEIVPGYHRILREAEALAPKAYAIHVANVSQAFRRSLTKSWERGELPGFDKDELDILAIIFMSFRSYYGARFVNGPNQKGKHERAIRTYMKFVRGGIGFRPGTE
jgi:AcrR family transcriptional regulator